MSRYLGLIAGALLWALPSLAQTYPVRPVTFVLPFGSGSSTDIFARVIAVVCWIVLGCGLAAPDAHAACEPQRAAERYPQFANKPVKIGTPTTTIPFAYSNPSNLDEMTGVEIDLIEAVMKCAGLRYEYLKGPFSALIQSVMSGSTDVMIGSVFYRPERAEKIDLIVFMRSGQSVIINKGNPKRLLTVEDLCGKTASSTVAGASAAEFERQSAACVKNGKPAINYVPSVDMEAAVRQLANERVDFVMDGSISAKMRAQADTRDLDIAFTILTDLVMGPAVTKGNDEIRRAVLDSMQELERDGTIKKLLAKYELAEFGRPVELRR